MSLHWPLIDEAWTYSDPCEAIDGLLRRTERTARRGEAISARPVEQPQRDRYYTQARRLHLKNLMKGKI